MVFLTLMVLGVLALAGNVIFFSVWGLAQTFTFTAFFWATAIEGSKLVIASFLYRMWNDIRIGTKIFGCFLVAGMMTITSLGLYGHILSGHQQKDANIQAQELRIEDVRSTVQRYENRIDGINEEISSTREEISEMNQNISEISTRDDAYITARSRAADVIRQDRLELQERVNELLEERERIFEEKAPYQEQLVTLESEMLDVEVKAGPIVTLIEMIGASGENAMLWFILLIVAVFDPAAVYLTVQANRVAVALKEKKKDKDQVSEEAVSEAEASILEEIRKEFPDNTTKDAEMLELVRKLSEDSQKNSEIMQNIRNRMDQREKKENLKKELLSD